MQIDKIICLASEEVRLPFLAMERSLRATGCRLPIWLIPHDDDGWFDLPPGAQWWRLPAITEWLAAEQAHRRLRKFQCLTVGNYLFADTDVIFLRNPEDVLRPYAGLVASCTEWNKPENTHTRQSRALMSRRSSTWLRRVFNSGQFACDRPLFESVESLKAVATHRDYRKTCLRYPADQPAMNLLAFHADVPVTNLTLPPICMESTWAGDYPGDYEALWRDRERTPFLIHWAGRLLELEDDRPINALFHHHLSVAERAEWDRYVAGAQARLARWPPPVRLANRILRRVYPRYRIYRAW